LHPNLVPRFAYLLRLHPAKEVERFIAIHLWCGFRGTAELDVQMSIFTKVCWWMYFQPPGSFRQILVVMESTQK
jgi:hypothetical protein